MSAESDFSAEEMQVLRPLFLSSSDGYLKEIRRILALAAKRGALAADTLQTLHRAIHSLKGSAFQIGLAPIGDVAKVMEQVVLGLQVAGDGDPRVWTAALERGVAQLEANYEALRTEAELPPPDPALLAQLTQLAADLDAQGGGQEAVGS